MKQLMKTDVKMTSLDIAELTGKRHADVMRDVRKEVEELGSEIGERIFAPTSYKDKSNRDSPCYSFGKDGAMQLALKYDAGTRYKVIKRIEDLENHIHPQPMSQLEIMQMQIAKMVEQEKQLNQLETRTSAIEQKQSDITEILSLNPTEWKKKVNGIINAIAKSRGGFQVNYADVRNESYQHLEDRAKCRLSIRLTNKKSEMALNGASKSKIDKVSKMDVIADDSRLTEIYLAIVKELAIKYGVKLEVSA